MELYLLSQIVKSPRNGENVIDDLNFYAKIKKRYNDYINTDSFWGDDCAFKYQVI